MFSAEGTFCAHGTTSHAEIQTPQLLREALRQGSGSSLSDATATEGQLQVLEVSWGCQVLETFQGNSGTLLSLSLWYIAGIYNCVLILTVSRFQSQEIVQEKLLHKFNLDKSQSALVFACFPPSHGAASPPGSRLHRRPQNTNGSAAPAAPSRRGDERPNCACL